MPRPKSDAPPLELFAVKVPSGLAAAIRQYAYDHRVTVSDLFREGVQWRIAQPAVLDQAGSHGNLQDAADPLSPAVREAIQRLVHAELEAVQAVAAVPVRILTKPGKIPTPGPAPAALAAILPPYDPAKYYLGALCSKGHDYGTGQSLRVVKSGTCYACQRAAASRYRKRQAQAVSTAS